MGATPIAYGGEPYYEVSVDEAVFSRLGHFPKCATIRQKGIGLRGEVVVEDVFRVEVKPPRFIRGENVPKTLVGGEEYVEMVSDRLYARASFMAGRSMRGRGDAIVAVTAQHSGKVRRGRRASRFYAWIGVIGVAALGLSLLKSRIHWVRGAVGPTCVLVAIATILQLRWDIWEFEPRGEAAILSAVDADRVSKFLCGPDALFAVLSTRTFGDKVTYTEVLRLVRPSTTGCSIEDLRIAWECLGPAPRTLEAQDFRCPPVPSVWHQKPGHFVAVIDGNEEAVTVFDPALGVLRETWGGLRTSLSGIGLGCK